MPKITLPSGDIKEFDKPISIFELAQSIGAGLARNCVAGKRRRSEAGRAGIRRGASA